MIYHGFKSHLEQIFPSKWMYERKLISFYVLSLFMVFFSFRMDGLCRRIYNVNKSTGPTVNNNIETELEYGFC